MLADTKTLKETLLNCIFTPLFKIQELVLSTALKSKVFSLDKTE